MPSGKPVQFSKADASEAVIFVFSGAEAVSDPPPIRAKALDAEAVYTVRRLAGATKQTMTGAELMHGGLAGEPEGEAVRRLAPGTAVRTRRKNNEYSAAKCV